MIRILTVTLALLIAVTSQQMAMARGGMVDVSGQMVLCTGQGTITVTIDSNGNLIEDEEIAHFCPDCALTFADAQGAPHWDIVVAPRMQTLLQMPM